MEVWPVFAPSIRGNRKILFGAVEIPVPIRRKTVTVLLLHLPEIAFNMDHIADNRTRVQDTRCTRPVMET